MASRGYFRVAFILVPTLVLASQNPFYGDKRVARNAATDTMCTETNTWTTNTWTFCAPGAYECTSSAMLETTSLSTKGPPPAIGHSSESAITVGSFSSSVTERNSSPLTVTTSPVSETSQASLASESKSCETVTQTTTVTSIVTAMASAIVTTTVQSNLESSSTQFYAESTCTPESSNTCSTAAEIGPETTCTTPVTSPPSSITGTTLSATVEASTSSLSTGTGIESTQIDRTATGCSSIEYSSTSSSTTTWGSVSQSQSSSSTRLASTLNTQSTQYGYHPDTSILPSTTQSKQASVCSDTSASSASSAPAQSILSGASQSTLSGVYPDTTGPASTSATHIFGGGLSSSTSQTSSVTLHATSTTIVGGTSHTTTTTNAAATYTGTNEGYKHGAGGLAEAMAMIVAAGYML